MLIIIIIIIIYLFFYFFYFFHNKHAFGRKLPTNLFKLTVRFCIQAYTV